MLLSYDIGIVGQANVDRALDSLEKKFVRHNARVSRAQRRAPGSDPSARAELSAQRRVAQAAQAEERRAARESRRQADYWSKARDNSVMRNSRLEEREQKRLSRIADRDARSRARFVSSTVGAGAGRVFGAAKAVGLAGAAAVGVGGSALLASSVAQAGRLDEGSRRLAIQGRASGEAGADPDELRRSFVKTGIETGVAPEDVMAGVAKHVQMNGDLKGAMSESRMISTFAQASGGSSEDFAGVSTSLEKMGIKSVEDKQKALSSLLFQGKKGAFEFKDMAKLLPELVSQYATAGGRGVGDLKNMGGLLQVVQSATGSPEETATAVANMQNHMMALEGKNIGGKTFHSFTDKTHTHLKDFSQNIPDLIQQAHGDLESVFKAMDIRGSKVTNPFAKAYNDAHDASKAGGGKEKANVAAGADAVRRLLSDAADAGGDYKEVQRDAVDAMKSFDVQMENLSTQFKDAVASEVFPELVSLAPRFKELVPAVARSVHAFVGISKALIDHPLMGLGALIGASITYEVGKAGIASVLEAGVKRLLGGPSSGSGPASSLLSYTGSGLGKSAGGSLAGAAGAAGLGLAAGLTIASAIYFTGVATFEKAEFDAKESGKELNAQGDLGYSPEDVEKARKAANDLGDKAFKAHENNSGISGVWGRLTGDSQQQDNTAQAMADMAQHNLLVREQLASLAGRLEKAGVSAEAFQKAMDAAAAKAGVPSPNRGNSPSPVKP